MAAQPEAEWEKAVPLADVERWRHEVLVRHGCDFMTALELALNPDVDLHRACDLLDQGCAPEIVSGILS